MERCQGRARCVYTVLSMIVGAMAGLVGIPAAAVAEEPKKWGPHADVTLKAGNERVIGDIDLFLPLGQGANTLLFLDLRAQADTDSSQEGNLGLGIRRIIDDQAIVGGYAFYDRRETPRDNSFDQVTVGAEVLTENWDARVNGYISEGGRKSTGKVITPGTPGTGAVGLVGTDVVVLPGGPRISREGFEQAFDGIDFEVGRKLPVKVPFVGEHEIRGYAGGFHYFADNVDSITGPRARVEMRFEEPFGWKGSHFELGAEARYDDVRHTDVFVEGRLRIPIGKVASRGANTSTLSAVEKRMTNRVRRDPDIVTDTETQVTEVAAPPTPISDPGTGQSLNVFFVDNAGGGDCTQTSPCKVVTAQAKTDYGVADIIVPLSQTGTILSDIALNAARQQVVGGGDAGATTLNLPSGDDIGLTGLGARSTVQGTVTLADQAIIRGFDIIPASPGIAGANVQNVVIDDVNIRGGEHGIQLSGASTATVTNTSIFDPTNAAVKLDNFTGTFDYSGGRIQSTTGGEAVDVNTATDGAQVAFSAVDIQNALARVIDISNTEAGTQVSFTGGGITDTGAGIGLNGVNGQVNLDSPTTLSGSAGIDILGGAGTFTFTDTDITNPTGTALNVNGGSSQANFGTASSIAQNQNRTSVNVSNGHSGGVDFDGGIAATNGDGLQFNEADGNYRFDGTTTLNGGDAGIDILNDSSGTFTFADTTVTDPSGPALNVDDGRANVTFGGSSGLRQGNNTSAVSVQNGDSGTLTFGAGTSIAATNGDGLQFDNADGTYNFHGGVTLNGGDAGIDIVNGSAGTFTFSGLTRITNPSGGSGVNIVGGTAQTTFSGGLNIDTAGGTGLNVDGTGLTTVSNGAVVNNIAATGAPALDLNNTQFALTFDTIRSTNSTAEGIDIDDAVAGSALIVDDGDNTTFNDTTINGTGAGFAGIDIANSRGTFTFDSVDIDNTDGAGINLVDNTGLFTLDGGTIDGVGIGGIDSLNSDIAINDTVIGGNGPLNGFGVRIAAGPFESHSASLIGNTVTTGGDFADGVRAFSFARSQLNLTVENNTIATGGDFADGVSADSFLSQLDATVGNNTITTTGGDADGVSVRSMDFMFGGVSPQSTAAINNNSINAANSIGIEVRGEASRLVNVTGFANNTITAAGDAGVVFEHVNFDPGGGAAVVGGTTTIGAVGSPITGDGLSLTDVTGNLSFNNLDIANTGGTGLEVNTKGSGNTFDLEVADGTIDSVGGPALFLDPLTGDLNFTSVSSLDSPILGATSGDGTGVFVDELTGNGASGNALNIGTLTVNGSAAEGVAINNSSGGFTFGNASSIGTAGGAAFGVNGGNPDITYNGTIAGNAGAAIVRVANTTGGGVTFNGALTHNAGNGVSIDNTAGDVTFLQNLAINNSGADGVEITGGSTGTFTFADLSVDGATGQGVDLGGSAGTIHVNNLAIGQNSAIGAEGLFADNTTSGALNVNGNFNVDNTGATAVHFNGSAMDVTVLGTGLIRGNGQDALLFDNNAGGDYLFTNVLAVAEGGVAFDDTNAISKLNGMSPNRIELLASLNIWFVGNGAAGAGSQADPAGVADVVARSEVNDVIYLVNTGGGNIDAGGATLALKDNQTVISSLAGAQNISGFTFNSTNVALPTLQADAGVTVITLANNNRLDSFIIEGQGGSGTGVAGNPGATNTVLENLTVQNFSAAGGFGVNISPSDTTTINNSTFTNNDTNIFLNANNTTISNTTINGGGTGISLGAGGGDITGFANISNVDIDNQSVNGIALNNAQAGAMINITDTTIDGGTGGGLQVTNSQAGASYDIDNLDIGATTAVAGTGIDIQNSAGTFDFDSATSVTDSGASAFGVNGGAAGITYSGTIAQAGNVSAVNVQGGHSGTVTFNAGSTIEATNGDGLQFDNADGTYDFNGAVTLNGGDAGIDILNGSAGTFTFADTTITDPSGTGLNIDGGSANVTFSGSSGISQGNSASAVNVQGGHSGTLTFDAGTTIAATNGDGMQFDNADGTYNLNGTTTLNGGDAGIDILNGSGGTFTFADTTITDPSGTGLTIDGGSANATFSGTSGISQGNSASAVKVQGGHAGGLTFDAGTTLAATNGDGLQFDNADGLYNFKGSVTLNGGDAGIDILNDSAGVFLFADATITDPSGPGVNIDGGSANAVFGGINQANGASAVRVQGGHSGGLTFATTIVATNGDGLQFDNADGTYNFDGAVTLNGGNAGIDILNDSAGAFNFADITITDPSGAGLAIDGGSANATFGGTSGISQGNSASAVKVQGGHFGTLTFDAGSTLAATKGDGLQFDNADGTYNFNGAVTLNGGDAGIDILNDSAGTFTFANTTITDPSGAGLTIDGGSANATFGGTSGISQRNNASAVNVRGRHNGALTFDAGTSIATTDGDGLQFIDARGTYNFNSDISLNGGDAGIDIIAGGTFTFSALTQITNPTGGIGVNIAGAQTTFSGGLVINTTGGTGFRLFSSILATVSNGPVANSIVSTNAQAVFVGGFPRDYDLSFDTISSTNSPTTGIHIVADTFRGTFSVNDTTVNGTAAGFAGIRIGGAFASSGAEATFGNAKIENTGGAGIDLFRTTGLVTFDGIDIDNTGGAGVNVKRSRGVFSMAVRSMASLGPVSTFSIAISKSTTWPSVAPKR